MRRGGGRQRRPLHRRHLQQPRPRGEPGDRHHHHRRRQRHRRLQRRRRPGHRRQAERPDRPGGGRQRQPLHRRSGNNRVREVDQATGNIITVAGNGACGYSGDGGPATAAAVELPRGVAVDGSGNLFIADTGNQPDPRGGGRPPASSPPWPATARSATAATADPPPRPSWMLPTAWPWTPAATCSSPTTYNNRVREVLANLAPVLGTASHRPRGR